MKLSSRTKLALSTDIKLIKVQAFKPGNLYKSETDCKCRRKGCKAVRYMADGPATADGEVALGKNALIGFMTWEGYNYEDAVLLNENLV